MRILNLKGSALKEALDEMKVIYEEEARHMTLSLAWSVQVWSYISGNGPNSWATPVRH